MKVCSLLAPSASQKTGYSRPILVVKYLGQVRAYATYRDGKYEFRIEPEICEAIEHSDIQASFRVDADGQPVDILLRDVIDA